MLILSRRTGEAIVIDEKITLTVLSIKGRQVRLGIDAPDEVSVHREEIYQRIKAGEGTGFSASEATKGPDKGQTNVASGCAKEKVADVAATDATVEVANDVN